MQLPRTPAAARPGTTSRGAPTAAPATSTTPRSRPRACATAASARVAIVDVDAHHGNGAQSIFWERDDVFTGSVHVDPAAGWFPHFLGGADERGTGAGAGANLQPAAAAGDRRRASGRAAVAELVQAARSHGVEALVLALGVDAAGADPESPLDVTRGRAIREAGRIVGATGLPVVVVQEGGYDLASIGGLVLATLEGLEEGQKEGMRA